MSPLGALRQSGQRSRWGQFLTGLLMASALVYSPLSHSAAPFCQHSDSDPDGDGWGWEDSASCIVHTARIDRGSVHPICASSASDSDGDGWGWENSMSCRVVKTKRRYSFCQSIDSDSDGDGWGWEANSSCVVPQVSDITDLILVTGQSNTLGAGTAVDYAYDAPDARVFAFTDNGWQVAQLFQTWDRNSYPGPGSADAAAAHVYNNFALHFGKRLTQLDPTRVVGFLLVSEPGEGIENWNPGANGMQRVQRKVLAAINQLAHKSSLDGILWHQGETDWQFEGSSDPDVQQPAAVDYYPRQLAQLIHNFRTENWFSSESPFICGETIRARGVNLHLQALNSDKDPQTACVDGFGLPATTDKGSHFTAAALRTVGRWYADTFFRMTQ